MDKSYRIHTNISSDTVLNVNMKQDFEFLEVLSLKLAQKDAYKIHSSNYGVIVGRVLANDAFGIPNAKISVFIERDDSDTTEIENIYPYSQVTAKDRNNIRYNLLPDYSDDDCYRIVGTFPNKRLMLDDDAYLEVYDKYWKYTTVTNNAGDYMIFGVPTGSQQLHVDIDLSDIGILSQKPRDFIYKGYNMTEFDNANQFKASTNLDNLRQIITQNKSVFVYPFWGDADNGIAAITRADVQVDYKFEPTCIFMGSIVSDNEGNSIGHKCAPSVDNGMNDQLIAGEGTIEMIRKTVDGLVEEYQIQGNRLIDSDGVWCYQIPMNLDYVGTDEYGNIVPTDNPNKGIPTRTQVRFRFSKTETGDEGTSRHTAKYLVPMNPPLMEGDNNNEVTPKSLLNGQDFEKLYNFGSNTPLSCFRDLYWNNVYSVKNYIPKIQVASRAYSTYYTALKGSNLVEDQNPIPFNKLRIDIPFMYMIVCILFSIIVVIISVINQAIICTINAIINIIYQIVGFKIPLIGRPFGKLADAIGKLFIGCISLGAGLSEDNTAYYPGCGCSKGRQHASCPEGMENNCKKVNDNTTLKDKIQQNLAQEYKIVKLDLYQDWINGCLYMPLWYWRKRKKKTFLFGLFSRRAKNEFCDCDRTYSRLKTYLTCNIPYTDKSLGVGGEVSNSKEDRWHKNKRHMVRFKNGLIKSVQNKDGLDTYYYTAMQPTSNNDDSVITNRPAGFNAIRLYATDIILLGNLNENNLYGLPQLFKVLPSTTANIPPIATIEESLTDNIDDKTSSSDIGKDEDSGTTITTGMDWGARGSKQTPVYKTGLFLDLACTYAATRLKSCINVERLSELGVNLDMSYSMSYSNGGNGIQRGLIDSDGFITKYELDDTDNRAAFATLNHIGFVPQAFQDTIPQIYDGMYSNYEPYTTQVEDENTNYLVPKFKFTFPTDFDGRMQGTMTNYAKGFEQALFDESDEAYLTFRLGAENTETGKNGHYYGRTRHFYDRDRDGWHMPLYNNSFYFYFGIKKGSTAIDKFNNLFLADCVKNEKDPFTLDVESKPKSYCECAYTAAHKKDTYATITVSSDDIQTPYAYTLYDSLGEVVVSEDNMTASTFTIGDINDKGKVKYQIPTDDDDDPSTPKVYETVDNDYGVSGLTNQVYSLVVIDGNGKKISRRFELEMPSLTFNYESYRLGTRFYNTATSRMDYICNEEDDFYGRIILKEFSIDGMICELVDVDSPVYNPDLDGFILPIKKLIKRNGSDKQIETGDIASGCYVYLTIKTMESESIGEVKQCFCNGATPRVKVIEDENHAKMIQIDVYQPKRYIISMYQVCDGEVIEENSYSEIIRVLNGENFNTFLNDMPTRFMLGTNNDSPNADVANTSRFYKTNTVTSPTDRNISGWFGVHQEDSYQFGRADTITIEKNQAIWEDFLSFSGDSIKAPMSKLNIINFKFSAMFSLSDAVYSSNELYFRSVGGVQPAIYRSVAPSYDNTEEIRDTYLLDDINMVTVPQDIPNIVGGNYAFLDGKNLVEHSRDLPNFNKYYDHREYVGNYFGAFTNNGGYKNAKELDSTMSVMRSPNYASVSPYNSNTPKEMGKVLDGNINSNFKLARQKGNQKLNGDKNRNVNPYLRAVTVDRRLDYMLLFIGPVIGSTFNLYRQDPNNPTVDKNRAWKGARVRGNIIGGIEMAYDGDYNIISADTQWNDDGTLKNASANKLLEYSYQLSSNDEDAKTIYNKGNANSIWERDKLSREVTRHVNDGYNDDGTEINPHDETVIEYYYPTGSSLNKRFYEASLGGVDIRDYIWSNFNKNRLVKYINDPIDQGGQGGSGYNALISTTRPYVFKYPSTTTNLYNGDFNREDAIKPNNYPTVRYIDVCNITSSARYSFLVTSCSYGSQTTINEDSTVTAETRGGNGIEMNFNFENPVQFVEPSADNKNFGSIVYTYYRAEGDNFKRFTTNEANLMFRISKKSDSDFEIYTSMPSLIRVLPFTNGVDGITYFKTATDNGEINARKSIGDAISNVSVYDWYGHISHYVSIFNRYDVVVPDDIDVGTDLKDNYGRKIQGRFFVNGDDEYITSNSNEFGNIIFVKSISGNDFKDVKVFSILVRRFYVSNEDNKLINSIKTIELSELIDCRDVLLKFVPTYLNTEGQTVLGSYVELRNLKAEVTVEGSEEEGGGGEETEASGEGDAKSYLQTVAFMMHINTCGEPNTLENQVFTDYDNMSFTFMFKLGDDEYYVDCGNVTMIENMGCDGDSATTKSIDLVFSMKCPQEMGILCDDNGNNRAWTCSMLAKTSSGFSYKLGFKVNSGQQELPTTAGEGGRVITNGSING